MLDFTLLGIKSMVSVVVAVCLQQISH